MSHLRLNLPFLLVFCGAGSLAADEIRFNRDIRPILSDACFACHGPDEAHREADLRLDVESSAKSLAIVPGDPEASELIARITTDDEDLLMPPPDTGKQLTPDEISKLKRWVQSGAPYEAYWAYQPPVRHPIPATKSDWSKDPIDEFLLARQQREGMEPSPDADRRTLIRRLTLDLTGLPPTPEEVDAFVNDRRPTAYRRLVDRLLASPEFGERMAIYWLDLVRYADTVGYHGDQDHNISPYRDYVIEAINEDLPLDQFTREQLAGDLLPEPTVSQLVATGYNRLLQTSHEGGVQPKEYLAIYAADRVRNLSAVWMGATVGCAQCHDHKYDPFTLKDFYSLASFFADIDEAQHFKVGSNSLPTKRPPEMAVLSQWQQERLDAIDSQTEELNRRLESAGAEQADALRERVESLQAEREFLRDQTRMTMVTKSVEPREIRILPRGNWLDDSGPIVEPAIPEFLGSLPTQGRRSTRLDLADWMVDANDGIGGMTARVFVNRYWYLLFGRGLSPSLADFGGQGQPPTHPKLLDHLAVDFVEGDWSVKRIVRRLVLSRAYRQSSRTTESMLQLDPYNEYFARQARYRLPAELVRDNALAISGMLVSKVGGASVKPHQPAGYYRHLNFPKRLYVPDRGEGQYRRGIYTHWQRQFLHPMLSAMDAPSREECTAERPRSNTPLEALVMLNDPSMVDASIAFASRLLRQSAMSELDRLRFGFQLATSRVPDADETDALLRFLELQKAYYADHPDEASALIDSADKYAITTSADDETLAAWTAASRAILNLHETVSRN